MNHVEPDTHGIYRRPLDPDAVVEESGPGPGPALMGASTLIGNAVCNADGDDVGTIKEIMLDTRVGRVRYAVLSFGGFLGMGEKLFAVPWETLQLDTMNERFTLHVDPERLKRAPGFDKNQWPNMADPEWREGIHAYYGIKPHLDELSR